MSFTGLPLLLDEWLDVGGGRTCNLTAAKAFSSQPISDEDQGSATPPMENLWAWYKADAQPYSDGAAVDPVIDSGPNGYHLNVFGNPPGFHEPKLFTNVLNGKPIFRWGPFGDGVLSNVTSLNSAGYSLVAVVRKVTRFVGFTVIISPNGTYNLSTVDAGTSLITFNGAGNGTQATLTVPMNSWQVVSLTFDKTEGIPRLKTNLLSSQGAVGAGGLNLSQPFLQGRSTDEIAEVLMYSVKLADDKLHLARSYLAVKYAIGIL